LIRRLRQQTIRNSVVIMKVERIKAVGQVRDARRAPGAEVISTKAMSVMPGCGTCTSIHSWLNGHSDYAHWDKTYPPQMDV
jgi:hypothetical protein